MENAEVNLTAKCPDELSKQILKCVKTFEEIEWNVEWGQNDDDDDTYGAEWFLRDITFQELVECIELIINRRLQIKNMQQKLPVTPNG